ncbi:hypothetical protein JAAARDRAFT_197855 [Jaapia argillacea MUCL 33604]|uniref:Uncharacterized protein n=1 Tax=Jaapia argillacea MUCL 33604 TaxID=933084 RepID=A0A067PP51_9AGAM|nr:hypothetical protein JAAARDRAFT_197855 [Jaapia argillacea MUCL 33604]
MDVDSEVQPLATQQSRLTFARRTVVKALSPTIDVPASSSLPESQLRFAWRTIVKSVSTPPPSVPQQAVPAQLPPPAPTTAAVSSEIATNSHPTFARRTIVKCNLIAAPPSLTLEVVPAQPVPKSQPTFTRRTVVTQVANPPLPLAIVGVIPAQPVPVPQIDAPKSEVSQQSQPTFSRRVVVKLPVIVEVPEAPPPPPHTNQDVNPPARMDVDNTGNTVSSEENPPRTAPITFARRKVANLPHVRTPAPNNAVPGTTDEAMEAILPTPRAPTPSNGTPSVDDSRPPTSSPAPPPPKTHRPHMIFVESAEAGGAPSTSSRSPLEFTPIDQYKLLPPSVSPQSVVPDWLGTGSPRAVAMYYDQAQPSSTSVQNPTFCQIDASGSSPPPPVDLDEMMSKFTNLHRLPDSHVAKSVQTIPHVLIPASEDKGATTKPSEGITAALIDKITQTPQMDDRPSDPSIDASNIAGPSMPAANVPNEESVWQLPPRPGWTFPGDYPSCSRLHLHDAHKRVILEATQDMHLLSRIARSLEELTSKINNLRELIWELEDGQ